MKDAPDPLAEWPDPFALADAIDSARGDWACNALVCPRCLHGPRGPRDGEHVPAPRPCSVTGEMLAEMIRRLARQAGPSYKFGGGP